MEVQDFPFSDESKGLIITRPTSHNFLWTEYAYIIENYNETYLVADNVVAVNTVNGKHGSAWYGRRLDKSLWFTLKNTSFSESYKRPKGVDQTHGRALEIVREMDEIMKPETKWQAFKEWVQNKFKEQE